jgi:CTP:molybdopterin cytidylyltransferase MocA
MSVFLTTRNFAAVLTAAGESTRMDRPKQLLEWHGVPLIQYQVRQLLSTSANEIVVVLGCEAEQLRPLVAEAQDSRIQVVVNDDYLDGKAASIKCGLRSIERAPDAVMLLAVDQPRPAPILQRLVDEHLEGGNLISVPSHRGKHGHPPVFSGALLAELQGITEEGRGLLEVIDRHRAELREVDIEDVIVLTNLNTPEDYDRALELLSSE